MKQDDAPKFVSGRELHLELKTMRSEFRLWLVGAVVANTTLMHITVPPVVGFTTAGIALIAVVAKTLIFRG